MKTHLIIVAQILGGSGVPLLVLAQEIAVSHHERWDGKGYPAGLKGEAIPLSGLIVAVADAYDAMTNDRLYGRALSTTEAWEHLWEGAGNQWDERVVKVFASAEQEGNRQVKSIRSVLRSPSQEEDLPIFGCR